MIKLFILIITFSTYFKINSHSLHEEILVKINNHIVTTGELQKEITIYNKINGSATEANNIEKVLKHLVDEYLLTDEANELGISVDNNLINDNLEVIKKDYGFKSDDELKLAIENNLHIEFSSYIKYIKNKILEALIAKHKLRKPLFIDYQEWINYYNNQTNYRQSTSYYIRELVFDTNTTNLLDTIQNELIKGTKFEELVSRHSTANSRKYNGNLGWIDQELLHPIIVNAINNTPEDIIIGPIVIDRNIYFITIIEMKPNNIKTFTEVKDQMMNSIVGLKTEDLINSNIIELRNKASIEYLINTEELNNKIFLQ